MEMVGNRLKLYENSMEMDEMIVGNLLQLYENCMKTDLEWNIEYENGWKYFKTMWKLYKNNMEMDYRI